MSVAKRKPPRLLDRLKAVVDARPGAYRELSGRRASTFGTYLDEGPTREDEEILTEPVLADVLGVLGFPRLSDGRALVESVERLVCRLYGLPRELEDAVVDHAIARARPVSGVPAE